MTDDRDAYVDELKQQLEEWNMGFDELHSRVERAEAEAQSRHAAKIERLRTDYEAALGRVSSVEEEGGPDDWDEFREGMEEARRLLDEGLEEARRELDEGAGSGTKQGRQGGEEHEDGA